MRAVKGNENDALALPRLYARPLLDTCGGMPLNDRRPSKDRNVRAENPRLHQQQQQTSRTHQWFTPIGFSHPSLRLAEEITVLANRGEDEMMLY